MNELIGKIEHINNSHEVRNFECGLPYLDKYIQNKAIEETENGIATTKVVIGSNGNIIGYYTISCSAIIDIAGGEMEYLSAIELKMFAINNKFRGKLYPDEYFNDHKYSEIVLWKAIEDIDSIRRKHIGAKYIVLYSVPHAVKLYDNNGFSEFTEYMARNKDEFLKGCTPMFLKF